MSAMSDWEGTMRMIDGNEAVKHDSKGCLLGSSLVDRSIEARG